MFFEIEDVSYFNEHYHTRMRKGAIREEVHLNVAVPIPVSPTGRGTFHHPGGTAMGWSYIPSKQTNSSREM